jgi:hypothetical protein
VLRAAAPSEILVYVLVTRPVAAALTVAATVGTIWAGQAVAGGRAVRRAYTKAFALASLAGCGAASVMAFSGVRLYEAFVPGIAAGLWDGNVFWALLLFALGRSLCEAGLVVAGSLGTRSMALAMGSAGIVGAVAVGWFGQQGWHAALLASATAWAAAGIVGATCLWHVSRTRGGLN